VGAEIDIAAKPDGVYRLVVWSVGPGIDRRYPQLQAMDPDVAVTARSADEVRLLKSDRTEHNSMAWIGRYPQRGLGVIGFGQMAVKLDSGRWDQRLEWIAPVSVAGLVTHRVLAVWAMNEEAQVKFKSKPPASQLIQMMRLHQATLRMPCVIAGDFNNNPIFHRNDPNWDMLELVALLGAEGFVSAYHSFNEIEHGDPREKPTRFTPEPIGGTVGHHVDYCFIAREWLPALRNVQVGEPEVWLKQQRAEEHLPVVCDFDLHMLGEILTSQRKQRN